MTVLMMPNALPLRRAARFSLAATRMRTRLGTGCPPFETAMMLVFAVLAGALLGLVMVGLSGLI